jgi:lipoprotein-releasing system permease protein
MKLEWYIARRYLASRRGARFLSLITLIAIGGVFVGVMALIVVTSVMTGLQRDLREKILGTNPHIWLTTYSSSLRMDGWEGVLERVRNQPGVTAAAPFVHTEVGLSTQNYAEFAILRGIDPDVPGEPITDVVREIRRGTFDLESTVSGFPPLLIGQGLSERFGLLPGDEVDIISLMAGQVNPVTGLPQPRFRKFEIAGVFRTGMYEYDNKFTYTDLATAQALNDLGEAVTGLEIRVPDAMRANEIGRNIEASLGFPYRAQDWQMMNASLFSALQLEKMAMAIILLLIVVVAAFNIISTLVMVVTDKTREIGILKSMGLTSKQVMRVFVLQGVVIGAIGSALGLAGGLFLVWLLDRYQFISIPGDIYFIERLPVALQAGDIGLIMALSVVISFLATLYPALQAARLMPVEAIRHE